MEKGSHTSDLQQRLLVKLVFYWRSRETLWQTRTLWGKEAGVILPGLRPPSSYFCIKHWRCVTFCTELRLWSKWKVLCNRELAEGSSDSRWEGVGVSPLLPVNPSAAGREGGPPSCYPRELLSDSHFSGDLVHLDDVWKGGQSLLVWLRMQVLKSVRLQQGFHFYLGFFFSILRCPTVKRIRNERSIRNFHTYCSFLGNVKHQQSQKLGLVLKACNLPVGIRSSRVAPEHTKFKASLGCITFCL